MNSSLWEERTSVTKLE